MNGIERFALDFWTIAAPLILGIFIGIRRHFKFGAAHILFENKERARVYTELLSKFKSDFVSEAINDACLESPRKMPAAYTIVSHCRRLRAKQNNLLLAAGEQRGMDETHKFNFESGEWLPK